MFNRKVEPQQMDLSMILSNEQFAKFLDSLKWEYDPNRKAEFTFFEKLPILLQTILRETRKMKLDSKGYYREGHLLLRIHKDLPNPKQEPKKSFSVTKILRGQK